MSSELEKELRKIFDNVNENGDVSFNFQVEHAAALLDVLKFTVGATEILSAQQIVTGNLPQSNKYKEVAECAEVLYQLLVKAMGTEAHSGETIH